MDLHKTAQIFAVPIAVLVPALGVATTEPLKVMIAALGLVMSMLWYLCNRDLSVGTKRHEQVISLLPLVFGLCWTVALLVHSYWWWAEPLVAPAKPNHQPAAAIANASLPAMESAFDINTVIFVCTVVATLTSIAGIWYAARESHRNNHVYLAIRECRASMTEAHDRWRSVFNVVITNRGISLHNVVVTLAFKPEGDYGWRYVELNSINSTGEFAKGMIGEFFLDSATMKPSQIEFVANLKSSRNQKARFEVRSQGYLAYQFPAYGIGQSARDAWNWLALKLQFWSVRPIGHNESGTPMIRMLKLPCLPSLRSRLDEFVKRLEGI